MALPYPKVWGSFVNLVLLLHQEMDTE